MQVTIPALRDLKSRARECLHTAEMIAHWCQSPEWWTERFDVDGKVWPARQKLIEQASSGFAGKDELLWFVATEGVATLTDWKLSGLRLASAHAWAMFCGSVLSRWDGITLWESEDEQFKGDFIQVVVPNDSGGEYLVYFKPDADFGRLVKDAEEAIELEHRRAARYVMDRGGSVEVGPPVGVAIKSTPAANAAEPTPNLKPSHEKAYRLYIPRAVLNEMFPCL
ncbi:MAG: hypothetical protein H0T47_04260 [Planctomycetaceae bacterium]|nr:hypothetical protein [Planctomycetaceae bacterium]